MQTRIGVAIGRKSGTLLVAHRNGSGARIVFHHELARPDGKAAAELLAELFAALPPNFRKTPVSIALSSGDLACADIWEPPEPLARSGLETVAFPLCEARCAGETLEALSVDVVHAGRSLQAAALPNDILADLRRVAGACGLALDFVTALPSVLAGVFSVESSIQLLYAGDRIEVRREDGRLSWRSYPMDLPEPGEPDAAFKWQEAEIPKDLAPAFAAAVVDPDAVPNVLRGAPDAPRSPYARFRRPLLWLAGMAAAMLLGLSLWLDRRAHAVERDLAALAETERRFWKNLLPGKAPQDGELLRSMRDRLREAGDPLGQKDYPSALSFWAELGKHMPDAEAIGMTLESLDLSPDGGRLTATVAAVPGDELRNASLVEAKLSASPWMTARGDFERREREIQLRLKIDYRPPTEAKHSYERTPNENGGPGGAALSSSTEGIVR